MNDPMSLRVFARRYGPLGAFLGALVAGVGILLAVCRTDVERAGKSTDAAVSQEARESKQNGRLEAGETWRAEHDALTKPLIEEFRKVQRGQVALLTWARMVSEYEGWPAPPEPAGCGPETCAEEPPGIRAATSP